MKHFLSFLSCMLVVINLNANLENSPVLPSEDCDEFAALVFVGTLQRGKSCEEAFDLALWAKNDCESMEE